MASRSAIVGFIFAVAVGPLSLLVHAQAGHSSEAPGRAPAADDFEEAKQLLQKGLLDEAGVAARHGLDRSPKSVVGLNLLGVIYQQQGKDAEAIPQFERALAIKPDSVDTLNNLATSYAAQKRTDLAEQIFRKKFAIEARRRDSKLQPRIAAARSQQGERIHSLSSARSPSRRAYALEPGSRLP